MRHIDRIIKRNYGDYSMEWEIYRWNELKITRARFSDVLWCQDVLTVEPNRSKFWATL